MAPLSSGWITKWRLDGSANNATPLTAMQAADLLARMGQGAPPLSMTATVATKSSVSFGMQCLLLANQLSSASPAWSAAPPAVSCML